MNLPFWLRPDNCFLSLRLRHSFLTFLATLLLAGCGEKTIEFNGFDVAVFELQSTGNLDSTFVTTSLNYTLTIKNVGTVSATAVSMAMDRRELHSWQVANSLLGICIFSDASPVIGKELQGMVAEFLFKDGSMRRRTLPGSTMAYGHCDWVSKATALVWAVFLIAGPTLEWMQLFLAMCGL